MTSINDRQLQIFVTSDRGWSMGALSTSSKQTAMQEFSSPCHPRCHEAKYKYSVSSDNNKKTHHGYRLCSGRARCAAFCILLRAESHHVSETEQGHEMSTSQLTVVVACMHTARAHEEHERCFKNRFFCSVCTRVARGSIIYLLCQYVRKICSAHPTANNGTPPASI